MQIFERLEEYSTSKSDVILTIGNFDGMHRGHGAVLQKAKSLAGSEGEIIALTFRNHPSEVLRPEQLTSLISTLPHKLLLLEEFGIHKIILLSFTRYLAQHSAASFIEYLRQTIPFTHLVLGHDATLGRDRQGDKNTMQTLGMEWGFNVHYLDEYRYEGQPVSSSLIRKLIQEGNLDQVELLLNRPYSIYGPVFSGKGKGKQWGFPTANLDVSGLCLPPLGVYAVEVVQKSKNRTILPGVANLGVAPTVREDATHPLLEVHLFDEEQSLYGDYLEVIFKKFIRPEQKFSSVEELRKQIREDIAFTKENCKS